MKKVGIFGIGAIGSVLTKYLIRNVDNEYHFFNRTKNKSISITHMQQVDEIPLDFSKGLNTNLDWLIVCLKEYQVKEALADIQKLVGHQTKLAIFQNGLNLSMPYNGFAESKRVLETIIDCPMERVSKDQFIQIRKPLIILPKSHIADHFINLFDGTEVEFEQALDFKKVQWTKLIESSAIGAILSFTGKTCSIFQQADYLEEYTILVNEGIEVARSEGISIDDDLSDKLVTKLLSYPASKGSSMLTDKLNGQALELDAKIGAILKIANRNKISVPNSNKYYESLLHYNNMNC